MEKFDYNAKMLKFLGSVFALFFFFGVVYGGYLFYIYKKMPGVKTNVQALYSLFTAGQSISPRPVAHATPATGGSWTTINSKTSDETIIRLSSMSDKEIKEKLKEVKGYDDLFNGNSLKLLKMIADLISKSKDTAVISGEDERQIKGMLEKIIDDYNHNRIPGLEDIEKETGKW